MNGDDNNRKSDNQCVDGVCVLQLREASHNVNGSELDTVCVSIQAENGQDVPDAKWPGDDPYHHVGTNTTGQKRTERVTGRYRGLLRQLKMVQVVRMVLSGILSIMGTSDTTAVC